MKKSSKLVAALLAFFAVVTLFAACGKDGVKDEESTAANTTVQANAGVTEDTTVAETTTKAETTTAQATTKAKTTKPKTTKPQPTTKVQDNGGSETTTKPEPTSKEEFIAPNYGLLIGTWDATMDVEGIPVSIQFEFSIVYGKKVEVDFTKIAYDNMIEKAVEMDLAQVTDEELTEAGFADRAEYEVALREYLIDELPYDELRSMFQSTGTWELIGDKLTIVIAGETMTADTQLSDDVRTFELVDAYGEKLTLKRR